MAKLTAAHIGYEYQDLLVAVRLVDVLLGAVSNATVDQKLVDDDRFDDLTCIDADQRRVRCQFKHTENDDRPLTLASFTNDARGLRLDKLISCMLSDRAGPGSTAASTTFRLVLRDRIPTDADLVRLLRSATPDPGPFVEHLGTNRQQFDADSLWAAIDSADGVFSSVRSELPHLTRTEVDWFCEQLIVELDAPPSSLDLTSPGDAEELLLRRIRTDVGAESFPNAARHAVDVAAAFVSAARAARQGRLHITPEELLRRSQLRSDFGAVTRSDPVDRLTQVPRAATVDSLLAAATVAAADGGCLLVTGPPGHGKSWVCQQLLERMDGEGWLVAEHYCFLGDADGERLERVLTEHLLGSLVGRLAKADPQLVDGQRPRYAADEDALVNCVARAVGRTAARPVALVVDGLDHITRVRSAGRRGFDPSLSVAETLASLDLPAGSVLIVLSQPGPHLAPLMARSHMVHTVAELAADELRQLAQRHAVIPSHNSQRHAVPPLLDDDSSIEEFLDALLERSRGNALYATYLCREAIRIGADSTDAASAVRRLPPFDGSLENYYAHLQQSLGGDAGWVAEIIALAGFGISRSELREIMPEFAHRVEPALETLAPVLREHAGRGIRIYHESFARYLRQSLLDAPNALAAQLARLSGWLQSKGLFTDSRAYRFLMPLLAESEQYDRVVDLVGLDFVTESIAAMFPASAIKANLAVAIRSAAARSQWPLIVRYVEMSRAAESYETERYDSILVDFADVHIELLGATAVAERMLHDGRISIPARSGLQMCAAIDAFGGVAPWAEYMEAFQQEDESDNTHYGEHSDRAVSVAWARGRLRLAKQPTDTENHRTSETPQPSASDSSPEDGDLDRAINWRAIAEWLDDEPLVLPDVIVAVVDTHGATGVHAILEHIHDRSLFCLAVAESIASGVADAGLGSVQDWAAASIGDGGGPRFAQRVLTLGIGVERLSVGSPADERARLFDLTQRVQEPRVRWESGVLDSWVDSCAIAAHLDPDALDLADGLVIGEGWYRCWLRFAVALAKAEAEASVEDRSSMALDAISRLTEDVRPFVGDPRSCDLYSIHPTIAESIRRAVRLLQGSDWAEGVHTLKYVSDRITTTLWGERGGPVPVELIFDLATKTAASAEHRELVGLLIRSEVEERSGGRYYSDLASYRLYAARLALSATDSVAAATSWREACGFLSGYGWHKDITIYELLDPLGVLIDADPRRGRRRVADVQGLCERVPMHTDKKETRGAWGRWWKLLAAADPVAVARLAAPQLLSECNHPNWLLNEAIEELWRAAAVKADPVVSAALRLSLESPLEPEDAPLLERLLATPEADDPVVRRLMVMMMARVDERPVSYAFSNSDELLAREDARVDSLNAVASTARLPSSITSREPSPAEPRPSPRSPQSRGTRSEADGAPAAFRTGAPGLGQAIRRWHNRPYDNNTAEWSTARFAAAIGYRLVELAESGRAEEAESALQTLADFIDYGDRSGLLKELADGLERHGLDQLAAVAYVLAWTRARGHGGWLSFGGETEFASLQRACELDHDTANSVVASEVERFVVSDRHGTYGISQALIHALAKGSLAVADSLTMAFSAWDEARAVIELRAPIVHSSDIPAAAYGPEDTESGSAIVGDLDEALAIATVAGLAHPSRERKRRTLVAIDTLLRLRSEQGAASLAVALSQPCDPATHGWLLSLASERCTAGDPTWAVIRDPCLQLAMSEYLSVRTSARRLLDSAAPELPTTASPHPMLTRSLSGGFWLPDDPDEPDSEQGHVAAIVRDVAGQRLARSVSELPGLEDAVHATVADAMRTEGFQELMDEQVRSFADTGRKRWPDAYLVNEQTVEQALQSVASGGRAARMTVGQPSSDPASWEDALGCLLLDEPAIPLALEMTRQCRPPIPRVDPPRAEWWTNVRSGKGVVTIDLDHGQVNATISLEPATSALRLHGGQFDNWYLIGTYEVRRFNSPDFRSDEVLIAERYRMVEFRQGGDTTALHLPPVTASDLRMWNFNLDPPAGPELEISQPLVGVDRRLRAAGDGHRGLGVPDAILTPTPNLMALLGLRPQEELELADDIGAALGCITWRTDYDVSDYYLPVANTTGCGLALRPDLYEKLADDLGPRLVVRDFVVADQAFGAPSRTDGEPGSPVS